eukprot:TRINITY_DN882_c0_g1_i2.p1 TRINITY_DN882_c0_g1~~TRINITY_DN882_c0_g1_i2.p1  ORF type:complete len:1171 (-),score=202.14 TRINITY_DN882_c0_g1_i2:115-3627(-)
MILLVLVGLFGVLWASVEHVHNLEMDNLPTFHQQDFLSLLRNPKKRAQVLSFGTQKFFRLNGVHLPDETTHDFVLKQDINTNPQVILDGKRINVPLGPLFHGYSVMDSKTIVALNFEELHNDNVKPSGFVLWPRGITMDVDLHEEKGLVLKFNDLKTVHPHVAARSDPSEAFTYSHSNASNFAALAKTWKKRAFFDSGVPNSSPLLILRLMVETDNRILGVFSNDPTKFTNWLLNTVSTSNSIFERDVRLSWAITSINLHADGNAPAQDVFQLQTYLEQHLELTYGLGATMIVNSQMSLPGWGEIDNVCNYVGTIQCPISSATDPKWAVKCFTHESGHVVGGHHTHESPTWQPLIDNCPAGQLPTDGSGVIMSYCESVQSAGWSGVTFVQGQVGAHGVNSERVPQRMRKTVEKAGCGSPALDQTFVSVPVPPAGETGPWGGVQPSTWNGKIPDQGCQDSPGWWDLVCSPSLTKAVCDRIKPSCARSCGLCDGSPPPHPPNPSPNSPPNPPTNPPPTPAPSPSGCVDNPGPWVTNPGNLPIKCSDAAQFGWCSTIKPYCAVSCGTCTTSPVSNTQCVDDSGPYQTDNGPLQCWQAPVNSWCSIIKPYCAKSCGTCTSGKKRSISLSLTCPDEPGPWKNVTGEPLTCSRTRAEGLCGSITPYCARTCLRCIGSMTMRKAVDSLPLTLSSATVTSAVGEVDSSMMSSVVSKFNEIRSEYGSGALTWDRDLAAQAFVLASTCTSNQRSHYPSTIFAAATTSSTDVFLSKWLSEKLYFYCELPPGTECMGGWCGNFKHILYQSATRVGCAISNCTSGTGSPSRNSSWNNMVCVFDADLHKDVPVVPKCPTETKTIVTPNTGLLFDQGQSCAVNRGLVTGHFKWMRAKSRALDDFTVSAGNTWTINSVSVLGSFFGKGIEEETINWTVSVFHNYSLMCTSTAQTPPLIQSNPSLNPPTELKGVEGVITTLNLSTPCMVVGGHVDKNSVPSVIVPRDESYYISVYPSLNHLHEGELWRWSLSEENHASHLMYKDASRVFTPKKCTEWTTGNSCGLDLFDFAGLCFQLFGISHPTTDGDKVFVDKPNQAVRQWPGVDTGHERLLTEEEGYQRWQGSQRLRESEATISVSLQDTSVVYASMDDVSGIGIALIVVGCVALLLVVVILVLVLRRPSSSERV